MSVTITFEKTECSRCGGTGRYSFCQMYGTMCFKCSGTGRQFSRAGAASYKAYQAWADAALAVPVAQLKVGDKIKVYPSDKGYRTVTVAPELQDRSGTLGPDGKVIPAYLVRTQKVAYILDREATVRRPPTEAELRAVGPTLGKGATLGEKTAPATTTQEA